MSEPRCDCCDLPVSGCGKAAEKRQRAERAENDLVLLSRRGWFPAQYPGTCSGCGERFEAGEPIGPASLTGWKSGWIAGCCAP